MKARPRGQTKQERGQSLVEFSLMLVIITTILLGLLDLGRAYFTFLALQDLAEEGASFGSVHPTWVDGSLSGADDDSPNNIEYRVKNGATGLTIDLASATVGVAYNPSSTTTVGSEITVTVTADYELLTPFVGGIVGSQVLPLSARATALITSND